MYSQRSPTSAKSPGRSRASRRKCLGLPSCASCVIVSGGAADLNARRRVVALVVLSGGILKLKISYDCSALNLQLLVDATVLNKYRAPAQSCLLLPPTYLVSAVRSAGSAARSRSRGGLIPSCC